MENSGFTARRGVLSGNRNLEVIDVNEMFPALEGTKLCNHHLSRGQTFHTVLPGNSTPRRAAGGRTQPWRPRRKARWRSVDAEVCLIFCRQTLVFVCVNVSADQQEEPCVPEALQVSVTRDLCRTTSSDHQWVQNQENKLLKNISFLRCCPFYDSVKVEASFEMIKTTSVIFTFIQW